MLEIVDSSVFSLILNAGMAANPKQSDIPVEIRLDVQYAQPKNNPFGLSEFDRSGFGKKTEYVSIPGHHGFHREFLAMSAALENAAREYDAGWSVERTLKDPKSKWDPKEDSKAYYDGGYADLLYQAAILTSSLGAAVKIFTTVRPVIIKWLENRGAASLRVKVGTSEVSVRGPHDVDEILRLLNSVAAKKADKAKSSSTKKVPARSSKKANTSKKKPAAAKKTSSRKQSASRKTKAKSRS